MLFPDFLLGVMLRYRLIGKTEKVTAVISKSLSTHISKAVWYCTKTNCVSLNPINFKHTHTDAYDVFQKCVGPEGNVQPSLTSASFNNISQEFEKRKKVSRPVQLNWLNFPSLWLFTTPQNQVLYLDGSTNPPSGDQVAQ